MHGERDAVKAKPDSKVALPPPLLIEIDGLLEDSSFIPYRRTSWRQAGAEKLWEIHRNLEFLPQLHKQKEDSEKHPAIFHISSFPFPFFSLNM